VRERRDILGSPYPVASNVEKCTQRRSSARAIPNCIASNLENTNASTKCVGCELTKGATMIEMLALLGVFAFCATLSVLCVLE
jgi:hypothetical protein